jgi:hypothetical protein
MNKLEIFQEVYGKDYAFTETELSRLLRVTELIVRECTEIVADAVDHREPASTYAGKIQEHFGIK